MRKRRGILPLALLILPSLVCGSVVRPKSFSRPELDIDSLGQFGVYGNYDLLTEYTYQGQSSVLETPSPLDGILSQPGATTFLYSPLVDGTVVASCQIDETRVFIAGNFSQVFNQTAPGVALLDISTGQASALGDFDLTGKVNALYCDKTNVFVGGDFQYAESFGVATWNIDKHSWSEAPWGGFLEDSVVHAIAKYGDSLVFGGRITGISGVYASNSTKAKQLQQQLVSYSMANVSSSNGVEGQSDSTILCENGSGWKALDNSAVATLSIDFGSSIVPARFRIYNLANDGENGTKSFQLITHPSNGIMNLTWTDTNGTVQFCDANCPLPQSSDTGFVDFTFVNQVQTTLAQFRLMEHYGDHAGINSVEFYQDNIVVSSISESNQPLSCQGSSSSAQVELSGPSWSQNTQASTGQHYMATHLESTVDLKNSAVTFRPNVEVEGVYTIQLYTPGCQASGDCAQRGQVNVTVYPGSGKESKNLVLYQTNEQLKYDTVYEGPVSPDASVTVVPNENQPVPLTFVAGEILLKWQGTVSQTNISNLFEYLPSNFTQHAQDAGFTPIGSSFINVLGTELGSDSVVNALAATNDTLYIGGAIANASLSNLILVSNHSMGEAKIGKVRDLKNLNGTILATADGVYTVSGTRATKIYEDAANVVPFTYNDTTLWALTSNDGISLYDPEIQSLYNGSLVVSGHLSHAFLSQDASFYIGSLQIQQQAEGGAVNLNKNFKPESLPYKFTSPDSTVYGAAYVNDSLAILAGHFVANTSDSKTAHNAIVINNSSSQPLFDKNELQDAEFTNVATNSTLVVLAGSVQGSLKGSDVNGLVVYNATQSNFVNISKPLSGSARVNQVLFRPNTSQLIVAGEFQGPEKAGCDNLCLWDAVDDKWSRAVSTTFNNSVLQVDLIDQDNMVLLLDGGSLANVTLHNETFRPWQVENLPNVTSFAISNNGSQVFVAGKAENSSTIIGYVSNNRWSAISDPFDSDHSEVTSLTIVPTTSKTRSIASNEMLLVFGEIMVAGYGQVSAITFDGSDWTPLFKAATQGQESSKVSISRSASQHSRTIPPQSYAIEPETSATGPQTTPGSSSPVEPNSENYMSKGRVVGISCAIAIGCVSLLVLIGLLASWISTRNSKHQYSTMRVSEKDMTDAYTPEALRGIFSR